MHGLFIQLNLKWMAHPFIFNSFKIKSDDQIQTPQGTGSSRSSTSPKERLPPRRFQGPGAQDKAPPAPPRLRLANALWELKKQQIEKLEKRRQQLQQCEKEYQRTIKQVSVVMQKLLTGSEESAAEADRLIQDIVDSLLMDQEAVVHLVNVKSKDDTAFYHTLNVSILALVLGREYGISAEEAKLLGMGALFHDIGKSKIPKKLLYKRGSLTPAEAKLLQMHPQYGHQMMSEIEAFPKAALPIIRPITRPLTGAVIPGVCATRLFPF